MSADLIAFVTARLDDDEAMARSAAAGPWEYQDIDSVGGGRICDPTVAIASVEWDNEPDAITANGIRRGRPWREADATGEHIARHDPARVLRDVAAKRAIVDAYAAMLDPSVGALSNDPDHWSGRHVSMDLSVRLLGTAHDDHPDYRQEWRP